MDKQNIKNIKTISGDLISIFLDTDTYLTSDFNIENIIKIIQNTTFSFIHYILTKLLIMKPQEDLN